VLPEAHTASEKLEMKGEKIDLNSIRNTVVDDLQGFKGRAGKVGKEMAEAAARLGTEIGEKGIQIGNELANRGSQFGPEFRQGRRGLGHALSIIVKAFVFLIVGGIAIALFIALITLLSSGVGILPLRDFLLIGFWQNIFVWGAVLLFFCVPILSILVWLIRRMMGVKTHNKYIGYAFGALWFLGLFIRSYFHPIQDCHCIIHCLYFFSTIKKIQK